MESKFKKHISVKTAIIAVIVLFSLMVPIVVRATIFESFYQFRLLKDAIGMFTDITGTSPMAIAESILVKISEYIFYLLNLLVKLGGIIFDGMLNIGFESHRNIVKAGWSVTRDFANMFFILFMVIIAFATILRTEKYGIKQLLPKVILIALLINFSLVICGVIIDFSNITAKFFINETMGSIRGEGGISGTLTDKLRMTEIYQPIDCSKFSDDPKEGGETAEQQCLKAAAGKFSADMITFIISMTMGSLVMLIAAFTFFAGAILLLIRIVIIWFLLMFVPLVFLCYIMPGLQKMWRQWWSTFLRWCFFAPAYAFFVWLAVKVAMEGGTREVTERLATEFTGTGAIANTFTSSPALIIHYLFIIALLLGGLIAASKFGIYGASTAMNIVQKAGKGVKSWAGRTTMRPMKALGTKVGAGTLTAGGKLFGGKIGRRMQTRAVQLRQAAEERPEHKKYAALLEVMTDKDLAEEIKGARGPRKVIAAKKAFEKGVLNRTKDREAVRTAEKTLRAFGYTKEATELKRRRFDAIEDRKERKETAVKTKSMGYHRDLKPASFEGIEGQEAADALIQNEPTISDSVAMAKALRFDAQKQFAEATQARFSNNFRTAPEIKRRGVYAAITGRLDLAFTNTATNKINKGELEKFVKDMKPMDWRDVDPSSVTAVGEFIDASAAGQMARHASPTLKRELAKNFRDDVKGELRRNPAWASYIS